MVRGKALAATLYIAAVLLSCCSCALTESILARRRVHLVGGYSLGRGGLVGDLRLYEPANSPKDHWGDGYVFAFSQIVDRIGWNEDFILLERRDLIDDFPKRWSSHTLYYILVVSTGEVRYAISHDEFLHLRKEMGVPDSIEMRDARQVYGS